MARTSLRRRGRLFECRDATLTRDADRDRDGDGRVALDAWRSLADDLLTHERLLAGPAHTNEREPR